LTPTFSAQPDTAAPAFHWNYTQYWYEPAHVTSFDAQLPAMQPGEVRQVSEQTEIEYCLTGGCNAMALAPLYVSAAHIVALEPYSATAGAGSQTRYAVTLANPAATPAVYSLTLAGLPPAWVTLPATVALAANEQQTVSLTVAPPEDAERLTHTFALFVQTDAGGLDQTQAELTVVDRHLRISLDPAYAPAGYGDAITYTVTISNEESVARTYDLALTGLETGSFSLPAQLAVAAHGAATATLAVTTRNPQGIYGFAVTASYTQSGNLTQGQARGVLHILGEPGLELALIPQTANAGPASLAVYTLVVTNTGTFSDTYQLNVVPPDGWTYSLHANGAPVTQVSLTPYLFNAAELYLTLTPPAGTSTGTYTFIVQATSAHNPEVDRTITGAAQLAGRGVDIALSPKARTADPHDTLTWNVTVTNTGNAADTFELFPGGIIAAGAEDFISSTVSLDAGASTTVVLTATGLNFAMAQTYPIAVQARSLGEPDVFSADEGEITFTGFAAVDVAITPTLQTITNTTAAYYLVVVTNTGNLDTVYTFTASSDPALNALDLEIADLYIPPHMAAQFLLTAQETQSGTYTLTVHAANNALPNLAEDTALATLTVIESGPAPDCIAVGQVLTFTGTITDPGWLDTHSILWDFGDGITTTEQLTATHAYAQFGVYTVTLTVSDDDGGVGQTAVTVTVGCGVQAMAQPGLVENLTRQADPGLKTHATPRAGSLCKAALARRAW